MLAPEFRKFAYRCFLGGFLFAAGAGTFAVVAVTISGTINSFTAGEVVSAATINENFASIKTAIEGIDPQYSTAETATHKVWVDGKTIYRKVYNVGTLPNNATVSTAHGIASATAITDITGFANDGTLHLTLPHVDKSTTELIEVYLDATNLHITTNGNFGAYSGYVIVEYVK